MSAFPFEMCVCCDVGSAEYVWQPCVSLSPNRSHLKSTDSHRVLYYRFYGLYRCRFVLFLTEVQMPCDFITFMNEFSSENKYGLPRRPCHFYGCLFVKTRKGKKYEVIYVCFKVQSVNFTTDIFISVHFVSLVTFCYKMRVEKTQASPSRKRGTESSFS